MRPSGPKERGFSFARYSWPFWAAAAITLAGDIIVEAYRGPIFAPSVRQYGDLEAWGGIVLFLAALIVAHLFAAFCVYRVVRRWQAGRFPRSIADYDFLAFAILLATAGYAIKLKLSRYFGDRIDLAITRELGGGDLREALFYAHDEAVSVVLGILPLALMLLLVRARIKPGAGEPLARSRVGWGRWTAAMLITSAMLLWVSKEPPVRRQVERFNAPRVLYAVLARLTDPDLDGYGLFSMPRDRHPFDPARHPFALDVPGNGIDEDDFGGDFHYPPAPAAPTSPSFGAARPNVVLIVLESTRADAIGKRWGGRLVAPNLTALAASGSSAAEAYSHHGSTAFSLKTIFTGHVAPAPGGPSLFRDFRRAGYRVAIFSSQSEDFADIASTTAMRENSHIYVDAVTLLHPPRFGMRSRSVADGRALLKEMDRRLGGRNGWVRPTFLYVNLQPAHFPYYRPGEPQILPGAPIPRHRISSAERLWVARTYWNAVAYADWLLGQVLARLKAAGVYERTLVVVVGDHGEELFENGYIGHGHALNPPQTRVPLVFSRKVPLPRPLGQQDLRALILSLAGAAVDPPHGHPVLQVLGPFDRPSLIAMVENGGRWTSFAPPTGDVWSTDTGPVGDYRRLPQGAALKAKVEQVVNLWMRYRWERQLASHGGESAIDIQAGGL